MLGTLSNPDRTINVGNWTIIICIVVMASIKENMDR